MKTLDEGSQHFEDFLPVDGQADIFAKVEALDAFVSAYAGDYVAGLGMQMLGPAAHQTTIKELNGDIHDVVMLGSNSYLALTTHPAVVAACKAALSYDNG